MRKLHFFNPGHESAILVDSPYYMPPANVCLLSKDLALLPLWYADSKDYVFVNEAVEKNFIHTIEAFDLPQLIDEADILSSKTERLSFAPWGLSQSVIYKFNRLASEGAPIELPEWHKDIRSYTHRKFSGRILSAFQGFCSIQKPIFCLSIDDIRDYMYNNPPPHILKSPYSSSGRGIRIIRTKELEEQEVPWIRGVLNKQKEISIEPYLNKKIDFALEFHSDGKGSISYKGLSVFSTETDGSFSGNYLNKEEELAKEHIYKYVSEDQLQKVKHTLSQFLSETISLHYAGYLGVDMIIYQDISGEYNIHPAIEINLRYTMGLVAHQLFTKHIQKDSKGLFQIKYFKKKGESIAYEEEQKKHHPLIVEDKRVKQGFLSLCPVTEDTHYLAFIHIDR